jgi:uncharacterized protein YndB with AHSA1/START domain
VRFRRLLQLASLAGLAGWLADRWLRGQVRDEPPVAIRSVVVVDAPIERTWTVLADIERQPAWMHELKAVRLETPGPVGVGTRGTGTVRILGITVEDPVEVTEFTPPTRFAIRHEGLFTGGGVITLARGADGTTTIVTWDEQLVAPLLPHLAAAVQRPIFARIFQDDLHAFARLVAAEGHEAS